MPARLDPTLPGWSPPATPRQGERIGHWVITGLLDSNERAEVYELRRADGGSDSTAAMWMFRPGADNPAWRRRIEHQRAALQGLDHPHLARWFDAGLGADGRAHVVVERVHGEPIDHAAAGLPLDARLALFLQLCDAMTHAHRALIAHGAIDANWVQVVEPLGGTGSRRGLPGQVKLLGLGQPLPDEREPLSTAADVLALGRLLYQLVTGLAASEVGASPPPPSQRRADEVRDRAWARTRRRLRRGLDAIVMKALGGGFPTVDELSRALGAWQAGRPAQPSPGRSGWAAATAGVLVGLLGVAAGVGIVAWQRHATEQNRLASYQQGAALKQVAEGLLARLGEAGPGPLDASAQQAALLQTLADLDRALQALPSDPDLQAMVALTLGRLAELDTSSPPSATAIERLDRALSLGNALWPVRQGDPAFVRAHLRALQRRARQQADLGQPNEALATLQDAVQRCDALLGQAAQGAPPGRSTAAGVSATVVTASGAEVAGPTSIAASGRGDSVTEATSVAASGAAIGAAAAVAMAAAQPAVGAAGAGVLAERAGIHRRIGELQLAQREPGAALAAFDRAEADLRRLLGEAAALQALGGPAARDGLEAALAAVLGGRATAHGLRDELPAMRRAADAALALHRERLERTPNDPVARAGLASELQSLALVALREGDEAQALDAAQQAWDVLRSLIDGGDARPAWADQQARLAPLYGRALAAADRHEEALAVYELAFTRWSAELARRNDLALRLHLTQLQVGRARSLAASGQVGTAGPLMSTALTALRGMASPAGGLPPVLRREAQLDLAEALATWAEWLPAEAVASRTEAKAALDGAASLLPLAADHARLLAALAAGR